MTYDALKCPHCGGALYIETEYLGSPYLSERTPTGISCNGPESGYGCGAEWETDGSRRTPPFAAGVTR